MADRARLLEVAQVFLKLGTFAFGGPAAHIGMMRDEVVRRRQWLSDQEFLDLLGAANLIRGPNSTEMTILLGARRAGWRGLIIGGVSFIVPAMLIVMVFGWLYVRFGALPEMEWLLYGVKPVTVAIIITAVWDAFMQSEFVEKLGWLTNKQLLDAIVVGQITPGPLFTSATFTGFILGGVPGAIIATIGIFLPAFILVAIVRPFVPRLRQSPWFSALLDGVNVVSLALVVGVTVGLGRVSLIDPLTLAIGTLSLVILLRFKINSTWLVLGGAAISLLAFSLR